MIAPVRYKPYRYCEAHREMADKQRRAMAERHRKITRDMRSLRALIDL